jgi:hypothetical protein
LIGQVNHDFIDIAPTPAFGRIVSFHDGMTGLVKVGGRVLSDGLVATADMAALAAKTQMHPALPLRQALFAAARLGTDIPDQTNM